jgi:hypothetical protein
MTSTELVPLSQLFEEDETAWLETMADLIAAGRFSELDRTHLTEYLCDMAKRDRREVYSRLVILLAHLLKWDHQPERRSASWRGTIVEQRRELRKLLESGTLHHHASSVLAEAYDDARKQAAADCDLSRDTFPSDCPWELEAALADVED